MSKIFEDISRKTGYPIDAIKVVASTDGPDVKDKNYAGTLKSVVEKAFAQNSVMEFKLKTIGEILGIDHTEVLKAAVSCGARLSKDAGGEFWVVGEGLVRLIEKIEGIESPKPEENRQLDLNDILGAGTINIEPEEKRMPKKTNEVTETVKSPAEKKPASKSAKASLKALVNSNQEMDVAKARKFLVQSKLKKVEEVAFMSDAEVSKIVNKDYAFLTVGNGTEQVNIAIPREELKKIDLSLVALV